MRIHLCFLIIFTERMILTIVREQPTCINVFRLLSILSWCNGISLLTKTKLAFNFWLFFLIWRDTSLRCIERLHILANMFLRLRHAMLLMSIHSGYLALLMLHLMSSTTSCHSFLKFVQLWGRFLGCETLEGENDFWTSILTDSSCNLWIV